MARRRTTAECLRGTYASIDRDKSFRGWRGVGEKGNFLREVPFLPHKKLYHQKGYCMQLIDGKATAAALRRCTGALLAGLDYMQALSCAADNAARLRRGSGAKHDGGASLWVLTHARRNCVHCQTFVSSGAEAPPHVSAPLELISPDEAVRRINAAPAPVVVGSGLARRRALFEEHCPAALLLPDAASTPSPEALWLLAQNAVYAAADIEPLYVRPCDAVENLSDIAARRGEAPEAAHAALARLLRRTPAPGEPA